LGEAAGQAYPELYAHACALRNRGTVQGVYGLQHWKQHDSEKAWQRASRAWAESEYLRDTTFGATHWLSDYDMKHCRQGWKHWIKDYEKTTKVGETTFYRRKK
jgi:hypothetical protein